MALSPGTQLGPYEIVAPLGAGGMGEVYRARDPRIGREVAIKVLPAAYSRDPERLRRFEQEVRAVGALNHPNILTIYDVGTHNGSPYVVSELLEGETLRERMGGSALPQRKAIEYASQAAQGLAAAHNKGIVHRDLKPENLFVTTDGRLKILDFGLAKLTHPEVAGDEAATVDAATDPGMVLGTMGYMSPEQVRGKPADHRADIFTFGAILYEMLTGRRAFRGESPVETMNAILKEDPPEADLAPGLDRLVRHCLEKFPEERFQSVRDLAFHLEAMSGHSGVSAPTAAAPAPTRRRMLQALAGAAPVAAAAAGFFIGSRGEKAGSPRFQRLTFRRGTIRGARFAPEGRAIVYGAAWEGKSPELFTTHPGSAESRSLGISGAEILAISSSGEMAVLLGQRSFGAGAIGIGLGTLARASLAGGAPREVLKDVSAAGWLPDGNLAVVHAVGGRRRIEFPIGRVVYETAELIGGFRVSPRGDTVAFAERPGGMGARWTAAMVDRNGKKTVISSGWPGEHVGMAWSPGGEEVWYETGTIGGDALLAVALSGKQRTIARFPIRFRLLDVAADGRVLVSRAGWRSGIIGLPPGEKQEKDLSWLDSSEVDDISPDGKTLLITEWGEGGGADRWSVYLRKATGEPAVLLGEGQAFAFSPDGSRALVLRRSTPPQLVLLPTGAGETIALKNEGISDYRLADFLPDGKRVVFAGVEPGRGMRCYVQDIEGGKPRAISPEGVEFDLGQHPVSPDGEWVVARDAEKKTSIFSVKGENSRAVPGVEPDEIVSRWSADGASLYVLRNAELPVKVYRVDLATGRRELWKEIAPADPAGLLDLYGMQISRDGQSYYYSYIRNLSDLYLVEGLK